jgi:hypothetical protein
MDINRLNSFLSEIKAFKVYSIRNATRLKSIYDQTYKIIEPLGHESKYECTLRGMRESMTNYTAAKNGSEKSFWVGLNRLSNDIEQLIEGHAENNDLST